MTTNELPVASNGRFIVDHPGPYAKGDEALLECEPGFRSDRHSSRLVLDAAGQLVWFPAGIACEPMTLSTLPETDYGKFSVAHYPPYRLGDEAELKCNPEYEAEETKSLLVLGTDGAPAWDPPSIACGIPASDTPFVYNGVFESGSTPYYLGDVLQVKCNPDHFALVDTSRVVVKSNGLQWEPSTIRCQPVACPEPFDRFRNGRRVGRGTTPNSSVRYECDEGHQLVGKWKAGREKRGVLSEYFCTTRGRWQPDMPDEFECVPVQCPQPEPPVHGTVEVRPYGGFFEAIATYTCDRGYRLVGGDTQRTCLADGTWSGSAPLCSDASVPCPPILGYAHVMHGDQYAVVDCGDGRKERVFCLTTKGIWLSEPCGKPAARPPSPATLPNPTAARPPPPATLPYPSARPPVAPSKPSGHFAWILLLFVIFLCLIMTAVAR